MRIGGRVAAKQKGPTRAQAQLIDLVEPLLGAVTAEIRELSKKKQDGILSPLKVRSINRLLNDVREGLGDDASLRYLDLLDEDELPQNSDAVVVLTQWVASVVQFRKAYFGYQLGRGTGWQLRSGQFYEPGAVLQQLRRPRPRSKPSGRRRATTLERSGYQRDAEDP